MTTDLELDSWRLQWQRQPVRGAAELKESVLRETRRTKVALLAPAAVTAIIGGWALLQVWLSPVPSAISLAIGVWTCIAFAWAGSLWLARGTWRPRAETTAEFLALAIRRCESSLRAVPFGIALYALELAVMFLWALRTGTVTPTELAGSPPIIVLGWLGGPIFVAGAVWYARRKRAELNRLLELRRQLGED
jgi:hypothetical protein